MTNEKEYATLHFGLVGNEIASLHPDAWDEVFSCLKNGIAPYGNGEINVPNDAEITLWINDAFNIANVEENLQALKDKGYNISVNLLYSDCFNMDRYEDKLDQYKKIANIISKDKTGMVISPIFMGGLIPSDYEQEVGLNMDAVMKKFSTILTEIQGLASKTFFSFADVSFRFKAYSGLIDTNGIMVNIPTEKQIFKLSKELAQINSKLQEPFQLHFNSAGVPTDNVPKLDCFNVKTTEGFSKEYDYTYFPATKWLNFVPLTAEQSEKQQEDAYVEDLFKQGLLF